MSEEQATDPYRTWHGNALYFEGKAARTARAALAEYEERHGARQSRTITLREEDWKRLDTALSDINELLYDLETIFGFLAWEDNLDQPGVKAIMRVAARGARGMQGEELDLLDRLDTAIRQTKKEDH